MSPEVNARLVGRLGDTFWVVVKCACGETRRTSFRAGESINLTCRKCDKNVLPWFNELDQKKILG